jgi:geranylgeranyl pyrophosphate synthase
MNLQTALQQVDVHMHEATASNVELLSDASKHILLAGGKRFRPHLLFLAFQAVGGSDLEPAVKPAAALEILHTATLAHDDINDHGVLRRNRPTLNAIWGRTFALLTGDYLFARVYQMLASYGPELNRILAEAAVNVVEGETLQAQAAKTGVLDAATYYRVISLKTAPLFHAAATIGALLGGGTPEQIEALGAYGFDIGLAFQIVDDVLDLLADSDQLGKTAGLDINQGKGFSVAAARGNGGDTTTTMAVDVAADTHDPLLAIKQQLLKEDTIEHAREQAYNLITRAVERLTDLPPSPAVDELKALAWRTVERDR